MKHKVEKLVSEESGSLGTPGNHFFPHGQKTIFGMERD